MRAAHRLGVLILKNVELRENWDRVPIDAQSIDAPCREQPSFLWSPSPANRPL